MIKTGGTYGRKKRNIEGRIQDKWCCRNLRYTGKIYVDVKDISPLGMGICVPEGHEGLLGKQVIVVAETLIMYAEVSREEKQEDGSTFIGVHAIKFTDDVLQYLFSHIG